MVRARVVGYDKGVVGGGSWNRTRDWRSGPCVGSKESEDGQDWNSALRVRDKGLRSSKD